MLKKELPKEINWFENKKIWVDLGYQGIVKDYGQKSEIFIPIKRQPKTKINPNPKLTKEQKEHNLFVSKNRVIVENAIGGMKHFNILKTKFKQKNDDNLNDILVICAGLWNFKIA